MQARCRFLPPGCERFRVLATSAGPLDFTSRANAIDITNEVACIAVSGPDVYLAGKFHGVKGITDDTFAHWNGTAWSAVGSGQYYRWIEDIAMDA